MREISCKIIEDLLPSYTDEICSDETRELVEEHLQTCAACRQAADRMKETEVKLEAEGDIAGIDYMKKLKKHVRNWSMFSLAVLFLVIAVGLAAVFYMNTAVPAFLYYAAVPALAVPAYFLLREYTFENTAARWKLAMLLISILDIAYMGILENWLIHSIDTQSSEVWQGPFAYRQFMAIALIHAVLFVGAAYMSIRKGNSCHAILVTSAAGGCAALAFASLLKGLDTPERFLEARNRDLRIILAEGVILFFLFFVLERRRGRA